MQITKLEHGVFAVRFDTQAEACQAFKRVQEFYENPVLKGQSGITKDKVDTWWKGHHDGTESYDEHWGGFNIPGDVLRDFLSKHEDLDDLERSVFTTGLSGAQEVAYLVAGFGAIGSHEWTSLLSHELAHAMYCVVPSYRSMMESLVALLPKDLRNAMNTELLAMGYDEFVLNDEIQAYLATGADSGLLAAMKKACPGLSFHGKTQSWKLTKTKPRKNTACALSTTKIETCESKRERIKLLIVLNTFQSSYLHFLDAGESANTARATG